MCIRARISLFVWKWRRRRRGRLVRCNLLIASINLTYGHEGKQILAACDTFYGFAYRLWFLLTPGIDCLEQFTILACLNDDCICSLFFSRSSFARAHALWTELGWKRPFILCSFVLFFYISFRSIEETLHFFLYRFVTYCQFVYGRHSHLRSVEDHKIQIVKKEIDV